MRGKKQALARILRLSGGLTLHRTLLGRLHRRRLLVFNYHRILPDDPTFSPAYEADVYHTTVSRFAAQVRWLRDHTEVLSQQRLLEHLAGRPYRGSRPASMITFDDGYADNYQLAFPVLRREGVPAMIFVVTSLVEQGRVGWWDIIAYLIRRCTRPLLQLDGASFSLPAQARLAADHFQERMKLEPASQTRDLLERLASACEVTPPTEGAQHQEMITWEQAREMDAGGFAVGAHTHTHRVLGTLTEEEQREELGKSREILEARLGRPVHAVAYPVGGQAHLHGQTPALARAAGYRAGFTYLTGHNRWGRLDPLQISRMEGPAELDLLAARVTAPEIFGRPEAGPLLVTKQLRIRLS